MAAKIGDAVSTDVTTIATSRSESLFNVETAVKEIAFGSVAGMVAELFEYPFDLAKVRLQAQLLSSPTSTALRFNGPLDCLVRTWKQEGLKGLYRGLPVPVVGSMAETASVFVAYTFFQDVIRTLSHPPWEHSKTTPLSMSQLCLASTGAGLVTSFILTPFELIKCKMQVQLMNIHPTLPVPPFQGRLLQRSSPTLFSSSSAVYSRNGGRQSIHDVACKNTVAQSPRLPGVIELTRSIVRADGFRGLWLGHFGTILRETSGYAAWFVSKEWVARKLLDRRLGKNAGRLQSNANLLTWESALSGGIAGAVAALVCHPADTVKSAIQTEEELLRSSGMSRDSRHRSSFSGTLSRMWKAHGLRGLYAGCGMTVARAVPSSGIIFAVYDGLSGWLS